VIFEKFEENPHLSKFYDHLQTHGLTYNPHSYDTQLSFLKGRIKQEAEVFSPEKLKNTSTKYFIVDRSIFEDCYVFAMSQYKSGLMKEEEFKKYMEFFQSNSENIRTPDLVIYLKIEPKKLHERIQKRGREMEKSISEEYLRSLQGLYESFLGEVREMGTQVVEVRTDNLDEYPLVLEAIRKLKH